MQEDQSVRMKEQKGRTWCTASVAIGIAKVHVDRNNIYFQKILKTIYKLV